MARPDASNDSGSMLQARPFANAWIAGITSDATRSNATCRLFRPRNNGVLDHEFVVGTAEENLKDMNDMEKSPDMESTTMVQATMVQAK